MSSVIANKNNTVMLTLSCLCFFVNMKYQKTNKKAPTARVGIAVGAILPFNPPVG